MSETVLVTGAAGFIGSHVVDSLVGTGRTVVAVDDLSGGFRDNVPSKAVFIEADAGDSARMEELFRAYRFRHVFHLAAYAAEGLSHFIRRFNYHNNLLTSVTLINLAVRYKVARFVFTSSIAVYGRNQVPMTEALAPCPEDPYGISKLAVELDLEAAQRQFGLDYVIFRPHIVYGPHQNPRDPYRNVSGIFMNQIMAGLPLTIFGDGSQTRAFSSIEDVAPVIARSVDVPAATNQVFNIGADQPVSVNDLAAAVMRAMGREVPINHLPARNEVLHAFASHDKVRRAFGLDRPPVPLAEGLPRMADWAKRAGPRQGKPFWAIEVPDGLPPSWQALLAGNKQ